MVSGDGWGGGEDLDQRETGKTVWRQKHHSSFLGPSLKLELAFLTQSLRTPFDNSCRWHPQTFDLRKFTFVTESYSFKISVCTNQ